MSATKTEDHGASCANCGAFLTGDFCAACGQKRVGEGVPLAGLLAEASSDVFGLESRLTTTLSQLVLRPGRLTKAYVDGQRVRYVAPMRLYLLASVAFGAALIFADESVVVSLEGGAPDRSVWLRYWLSSVILMMPMFGGLVRLAVGRGRSFGEHLVFAMHLHAVAFLGAAIVLPIVEFNAVPAASAGLLLAVPIALLFYLMAALRYVYGSSRSRAAVSAGSIGLCYIGLQLSALVGMGYLVRVLTGA